MENDKRPAVRAPGRSGLIAKPSSDWRLASDASAHEHERRREPLLMKQWKYLWPHEFIELRRGNIVLGTGYVDETTDDASIIWIHLANGRGRILIHHNDGIDIWRLDARIRGQ